MTETERANYRLEALRLSVQTIGEPNKVQQAERYYTFIVGPLLDAKPLAAPPMGGRPPVVKK